MTPDQINRAARALWSIRREEVDQCDLELEDLGKNHPIWQEARAAIAAAWEWRPIEEAPRDGTIVLVARYNANGTFNEVTTDEWLDNSPGDRGWIIGASYWMPLPTPPEDRHD